MESELVVWLKAKDCQRWPTNHPKLEQKSLEQIPPHGPQKEPTLRRPWSKSAVPRTSETLNFCLLSHLVCGTFNGSPSRQIHRASLEGREFLGGICLRAGSEVGLRVT